MEINWQNVFYFTASLAMIVVAITGIWLMWLFFTASRIIKNLTIATRRWENIVGDIEYLRKGIKLKVLSFILKILEKGGQNE